MAEVIHVELAAESVSAGAHDWEVNVSVEGTLVSSSVPLKNPIEEWQEQELKWYVEAYAQSSPYSSTKLSRNILEGCQEDPQSPEKSYAERIWDDLNLDSIIPKEKSGYAVVTLLLEILDESSGYGATSTVHKLHWELLEDPRWLGVNAPNIIVKRSWRQVGALVTSQPQWNTSSSSINILLIVARDLNPNPAIYNDISPWTAFRALNEVRQILASADSPTRVNIEIVRPGTFEAFQAHLEDSEKRNQNRPGYFHIVHFDLHGSVNPDKSGYLYFGSPDDNSIIEIPALRVAVVLKKSQVPCVVLNACESAKANAGDNANIASVLGSRGVKDVLAISYKFSARAAEIFLQTFYKSLLAERTSIAAAARTGRAALRSSPSRGARFRLERDIIDWFLPVFYSSGEDSVFPWRNLKNSASSPVDVKILGSLQRPNEGTNPDSSIQGRDFDVLRLEKMLLQKRIVFLHGPSGAGKSTLLRYAQELWTATAFLDVIVYIDFKERTNLSTEADMANLVLWQLLDQTNISQGGKKKTFDQDLVSVWKRIAEILQTRPTVIILDNMDVAFHVTGSQKKKTMTPHAHDVLFACGKLVEFSLRDTENPCYLVFVDCREGFRTSLSERIKHAFVAGDNIYQLGGLRLSDATELAHEILERADVKTGNWKNPDRAELQLVLEGLQCLPEALKETLPLANTEIVPWTSFYTTLICRTHKILRPISDKKSSPIWDVLDVARKLQPSQNFRCLMLLGAYWCEAPDLDLLSRLEIAKCVGGDDESMRSAVALAINRGLITETKSQGFWVHPLFTVFVRSWETWDRSIPQVFRAFAQGLAKIYLTKQPPDHWFIQAIGEPDPSRIKRDPKEKEFLAKFMAGVEAQYIISKLVDGVHGVDYGDMMSIYPTRFPNLLSFIEICRNAGDSLPLEDWPDEFLGRSTVDIRMTGRVPEMTLFAQKYELLLKNIVDRLVSKNLEDSAVRLKHVDLILLIANHLASTYLSDVQLANDRSEEFAKLALDIGNKFGAKDGFKKSRTIYLRGFAYRYNFMVAIKKVRTDNREESEKAIRKYWDLSDKNDELYLEALDRERKESETTSDTKNNIPGAFMALQSKSINQPALKAFVGARKNLSGLKEAIIFQMWHGDSEEAQEKLKKVFGDMSTGLKNTHDALEALGFQNLRKQEAWAPKGLNMVKFAKKYETEKNQLNELESAIDAGDLLKAADQHRALIFHALKRNDIDEAVDHVKAIENLYEDDPQSSQLLSDYRTKASGVWANRGLQSALDALSDESEQSAAEVLRKNESVVSAMKAQENPIFNNAIQAMEISGDLWKRGMDRDASGLVARSKNQDLGARARKGQEEMLRFMLANAQNPAQIESVIKMGLDIQTLFQKQFGAQEAGDLDEELRLIDLQLELAETSAPKVFYEFFNPEDIRQKRDNLELERAMAALIADGAREEVHLLTEMHLAARDARAKPPSTTRYDTLLALHDHGAFSHMSPRSLASSMAMIRCNRAQAHATAAFEAKDWERAVRDLDECLKAAREDEELRDDPRKYDHVVAMRETSLFMLHTGALERMDRECEYGDAQGHVDALRALVAQQEASPEVERGAAGAEPYVSREVLEEMQRQLAWKKMIIQRMGVERGKAFIRASRQAEGSRWLD